MTLMFKIYEMFNEFKEVWTTEETSPKYCLENAQGCSLNKITGRQIFKSGSYIVVCYIFQMQLMELIYSNHNFISTWL